MSRMRMAKLKQLSEQTDPWDEAFLRVEAYLHACKVEPRSLVAEITAATVKKARESASQRTDPDPVRLSMQALQDSLSDRFNEIFTDAPGQLHHQRARGRLALLISRSAPAFAQHLSNEQPCSPDLRVALSESLLQSGPELRRTKMVPAPLEFGFGDIDETLENTRHWLPNPALIVSLLVISAIGGALAAVF